ncbi:MAG: hypothetical protein H6767_05170 [Candidatus Peribacteria bacterium]|nr:MAG: hypothetical protein H6767_05170 [Candidatus Peribacteria bacterium]
MEDDKKEKVFSDIIDQVDNEFLENGYQNLRVQPYSKNPLFIKHNT